MGQAVRLPSAADSVGDKDTSTCKRESVPVTLSDIVTAASRRTAQIKKKVATWALCGHIRSGQEEKDEVVNEDPCFHAGGPSLLHFTLHENYGGRYLRFFAVMKQFELDIRSSGNGFASVCTASIG
eukprot:SAG31_NODE_7531_length_1664_cov_1.504792_1_plen_126_part_00